MSTGVLRGLVVRFDALDRFEGEAVIDLGRSLTALVGPNGSGKSTVLEAVAQVMTFLQQYPIEGPTDEVRKRIPVRRSTKPSWERAVVEIELDAPIQPGPSLAKVLPEGAEVRKVGLVIAPRHKRGRWTLAELRLGTAVVTFDTSGDIIVDSQRKGEIQQQTREYEVSHKQESDALAQRRAVVTQKLQHGNDKAQRRGLEAELNTLNEQQQGLEQQREQQTRVFAEELASAKRAAIRLSSGGEVAKADVEALWKALALPEVIYLQGAADVSRLIERLTNDLARLKAERNSEDPSSPFNRMRTALEALLKMHVTIETHPKPVLLINDRPVDEVSTGTWHTLGFASICERPELDGLIIWDEPETALHPTWARKVCDLMLESQTRRFLVASHRTEFVPAGDARLRVYRTSAREHQRGSKASCQMAERTQALTDALATAASLGLEPSRILFTTNAVLWVEGPSDVVYWRAWLSQRAAAREPPVAMVEGFDYAFLFSGGSLLARATVSDDEELAPGAVNLLRVVGASRVIVDADADLSDHADGGFCRDGLIREEVLRKLKPRVRKINQAISEVRNSENLSTITCTWGREAENSLTDEAFQRTVEKLGGAPASDVRVSRWQSYDQALGATTPDFKKAANKMVFAQAYATLASDLADGGLRPGAAALVDETIDWILKVRERYIQ